MAKGYATTLTQVKAILDGIDAAVMPIKFAYFETMPTQLPAGYVLIRGGQPERAVDTSNNEVTVSVLILAIFAPEESSGAALKWAQILDAITDAFRLESNRTLGGNAHNVEIGDAQQTVSAEFGMPALVCSVRLTAKMLKSTQ